MANAGRVPHHLAVVQPYLPEGMNAMWRHGSPLYSRESPPPRSRYFDTGRYRRLFHLESFAADPETVYPLLLRMGALGGPMDATGDAPDTTNPRLPAGFTYLGQFIDHDLSYDPTSSLQRRQDPESIHNYRTPALDLDSLYGGGPIVSPHLYERRRFGYFYLETLGPKPEPGQPPFYDLPRNRERTALVADPRNDENATISQLTVAFLRFHNYVLEHRVPARIRDPFDRFAKAQEIVRWHYQWIVLHQYLPRIVGLTTWAEVLGVNTLETRRKFFLRSNRPYIPVEFSVAAFRFGHSQIRSHYALNQWPYEPPNQPRLFSNLAIFTPHPTLKDPSTLGLVGGLRLPGRFVEWDRFFDMNWHSDIEDHIQLSMRIDPHFSPELLDLPKRVLSGDRGVTSLAQRDLLRHLAFSLPSGQTIARAMRKALGGTPLLPDDAFHDLEPPLDASTPLLFYILREAQCLGKSDEAVMDTERDPSKDRWGDTRRNQRLGPIGGRIVAEVLIGLLEDDESSFLRREPDWRPCLGPECGRFGIEDLLHLAEMPLSPKDVTMILKAPLLSDNSATPAPVADDRPAPALLTDAEGR